MGSTGDARRFDLATGWRRSSAASGCGMFLSATARTGGDVPPAKAARVPADQDGTAIRGSPMGLC